MLGRIYTPNPISNHWLNDGLGFWLMGIPGLDGGDKLYDLTQHAPGVLTPSSGVMWGTGSSQCIDAATGLTFPDVNNIADQNNYVPFNINGQYTDTANFSFEIFTYLPASSGTGQVFVTMDSTPSSGMQFRIGNTNQISIANGSNGVPVISYTYTPNTWYHFVGVINKNSNNTYFYVNGTLAGSTGGTTPSVPPAKFWLLRNPYPGYPEPAPQGTRIAYAKVWNGPLTDAAARALYQEFQDGFPNTLNRELPRSSVLFLGGSVAPVDNYFYIFPHNF